MATCFILGCLAASLHAFLLHRMTLGIVRGTTGRTGALGAFAGRLAAAALPFALVARGGRLLPLLVCLLGFTATQLLILATAMRRA